MLVAGIVLIAWNKWYAQQQHGVYDEALAVVEKIPTIDGDTRNVTIDDDNEGKLVHVIGFASSLTPPKDDFFGISSENALILQRNIDGYVRDNRCSQNECTERYSRKKDQSRRGKKYAVFWNSPITVGPFNIEDEIVKDEIDWYETINTVTSTANISDSNWRQEAKLYGNWGCYYGQNPARPKAGDTRISFRIVREQTISIVAKQQGDTLTEFTGESGGTITLVLPGSHEPGAMILQANHNLKKQTWCLRFLGFSIFVLPSFCPLGQSWRRLVRVLWT